MESNIKIFRSALIIDDEPEMADVMRNFMTMTGYSVTSCSNRNEGLAELQREKFDLILLDYKMEGMPAEVFVPIVRSRFPEMLIVLMTASTNVYEISSRLGVSAVLPKPFDFDYFKSTLSRLLAANRLKIQQQQPMFLYNKIFDRLKRDI